MSPKYSLALFLGLVLLTTAIAEELDHRHHPFKKERQPKGNKPPHKHHPGGRLLWNYAEVDGFLPERPPVVFHPEPNPRPLPRPSPFPDKPPKAEDMPPKGEGEGEKLTMEHKPPFEHHPEPKPKGPPFHGEPPKKGDLPPKGKGEKPSMEHEPKGRPFPKKPPHKPPTEN